MIFEFQTHIGLIEIQFLYFVAQIEVTRLSSKEKTLVHDRGRNFDCTTKFGTNVVIIKIQMKFEDELCGVNGNGNTVLQRKYYNPL